MDYKLDNILDIPLLQSLQDKLNLVYSFPSAIIDNEGTVLTAVAWQDVCTKFHRQNPECLKECIKSDRYILEHLHEANPAVSYKCPHGLIDNATPIIIDGKHMGNFFTGQFFLEKPDLDFFRQQAKKYDFDEKAYLEAVEKVPVWNMEKLRLYLDFIKGFIEIIAGLGYKNLVEIETRKALKEGEERLIFYTEKSPMAVVEWNSEFTITRWTGESEKIFGWKSAEVVGRKLMDLGIIYEQDLSIVEKTMENLRSENNEYVVTTNRNYTKDREIITCEWYNTILKNQQGEMISVLSQVLDITHRTRVTEEMKESEEKYRLLYTSMEQGMALHEIIVNDEGIPVDYIFLDINESYTKLVGFTRELCIGKRVKEIVPDLNNFWIERYGKVALTGEPSYLENYVEPLGKYFSTYTYSPKKNQFAVLVNDITERISSEKKLRESELKYRSLIESSSDAIFCVDEKGQYQFTNNLFASTFGKTPDYFIGKTFWDVYSKEQADLRFAVISRVFQSGKSESLEIEVPLPDKTLYFWATSNPIKDETGKVILNLTHSADITNLKKAQAALSESNLFNSQIINNVQEGIIVYDRDLRYKVWNPFMEQLSGIPASQVIGRKPAEVFPFLEKAGVTENLKKALNGETIDPVDFPFNIEHLSKSGWTSDKNMPFKDSSGNIIGVIGTVHDITSRKETEFELVKAKEKAEESDRLKSAFLANMSHEIRTPMNGILGFAELLKEPGLTGEKQQEFIEIIEKSGERMLNTINSIIEISKIESGLIETDIRESNINEQIEYIYSFFKPESDRKGLQFSFRTGLPKNEAIILTDREKLFAILTNLVKNAIKFTDTGSIEFGYSVETRHASSLLQITFYVKDTGIGIPINRQNAIFERFIQADIGDKRAFQGAGLGLAITKSYVEILGGNIRVESEEEKGSTFYFTLPYNTNQNISVNDHVSDSEAETGRKVSNLTVLIAEDDEISFLFIKEVFQNMHFEFLHAKTGFEAIELCRNTPGIDLILMDIKMPDIDGYEATRKIREFNKSIFIIQCRLVKL
jgi:PAS domain S-box-containing protein